MEVTPPTKIAWNAIAAQKQESLRTGAKGETFKQRTEEIQFELYSKKAELETKLLEKTRLDVKV